MTPVLAEPKSEAGQSFSWRENHQVSQVIRCAPGRIRTCDTSFRRAVLYPLSYGGGDVLEPRRETGPPPTV